MNSDILSPKEFRRYNRHIQIPEIGIQGQEKLKQAKVLVVGAGGLGAPVLHYLTAAGVGEIAIVDNDVVNEDNLQRQILYGAYDIGKLKTIIAREKLNHQNEMVNIKMVNIRLTEKNASQIIKDYDVIVDASDNFPTRYALSDACIKENKPLVHGAIYKFEGHVSVFNYKGGPSYRCLYPIPPEDQSAPKASDVGIIGVLPGIVGSFEANEVIKIITGIGEVISGTLFVINILNLNTFFFRIKKNPDNFE